MEEFKIIDNYDNYEVSSQGNVRNSKTKRILKPSLNRGGYLQIVLCKNSKLKTLPVHRLTAIAFIPNPENKINIDHIDNNRLNNNVDNLRWATTQENAWNRQITCKNKSGVKGISFDKRYQKWRSRMTIDGHDIHLGYFETIEEATEARQLKANQVFGVFTNACEMIA